MSSPAGDNVILFDDVAITNGTSFNYFSQNGDFTEYFVIMQVVRQDHHHRRGGDTHKEGKLGNIKAPRNVAAHSGNTQAVT